MAAAAAAPTARSQWSRRGGRGRRSARKGAVAPGAGDGTGAMLGLSRVPFLPRWPGKGEALGGTGSAAAARDGTARSPALIQAEFALRLGFFEGRDFQQCTQWSPCLGSWGCSVLSNQLNLSGLVAGVVGGHGETPSAPGKPCQLASGKGIAREGLKGKGERGYASQNVKLYFAITPR